MRALWPLLLLAGCGYTVQPDRSQARLPDGSLPRVAVLPFDNLTYRRGLEMVLSRLLADEIRARSPHAPTAPDEADWLLKGRIVRADERVYSEDIDDQKRESSFVVTVEVVLEERSSEKVLRTYSFTEREPFSSRAGRVATLQQAAVAALRDIAESIVYWLETRDPKKLS
ncbi:MAG: LPS assembly lipoprotein LptE [Planctomycetota bacterium]|jgi:hypothetical protein